MTKTEKLLLERIYELEQKVEKLEGKLYLATLDRLEGVTFGEYKNEWAEETAAADLIGSSREYIEVDSEETAILEEWIAEAEEKYKQDFEAVFSKRNPDSSLSQALKMAKWEAQDMTNIVTVRKPPVIATKNIEVTGKKECDCKPCVCMSNSESDNE